MRAEIGVPSGFDASGAEAEEWYCAPTNKNDVAGAPKKSYHIGDEKNEWLKFTRKPKVQSYSTGCRNETTYVKSMATHLSMQEIVSLRTSRIIIPRITLICRFLHHSG
jgi:hypothetical protein